MDCSIGLRFFGKLLILPLVTKNDRKPKRWGSEHELKFDHQKIIVLLVRCYHLDHPVNDSCQTRSIIILLVGGLGDGQGGIPVTPR